MVGSASSRSKRWPVAGTGGDTEAAINRALADGTTPVGVARIDVDHFGELAIAVGGRPTSDDVLRAVIGRIGNRLDNSDHWTLVDDDELVVVRAPLTAPAEMESLGLLLVADFERPVEVGGAHYQCSISVGVATSARGDDGRGLLRFARYALDDAKALGRARMIAFRDEDRELLRPDNAESAPTGPTGWAPEP